MRSVLLCLAVVGAQAGWGELLGGFLPDYAPEYADEAAPMREGAQSVEELLMKKPESAAAVEDSLVPVQQKKFVPNLGEGRAVVFRNFRKEGPQWSDEARMPNAMMLEPLFSKVLPMLNAFDSIVDDLFSESPFLRASSPLAGVFGDDQGLPMLQLRNAALMKRQPQQSAVFQSQAPAAPTKIQLPDGRVVPLPAMVTEALRKGATVDIEVRDAPAEPSAADKERAGAIKANLAAHQWQESGESAGRARAVAAAEKALEAERRDEEGAAVASGKLLCAAGAFLIFLSMLSLCCCCLRPRVDTDDEVEAVTVDVVDSATPLLVEYTVETVEPAPLKPLPRDEPTKI